MLYKIESNIQESIIEISGTNTIKQFRYQSIYLFLF